MIAENLQEDGEESFEDLQELFEELFTGDIDSFGSSLQATTCSSSSSSSYTSYCESSSSNNKRNSSEMHFGKTNLEDSSGFDANFQNFCLGVSMISLSLFVGDMVSTYYWPCIDAFLHNYVIEDRRNTDTISERGREFKEFPEEPAVAGGVAGGKRFHLVMTSPPTTTPVSLFDGPRISDANPRKIQS